jgi:hypothetical protein
MPALESRRRQATVDRLIDDLRRLVEQERCDRQPREAVHEQAERLRWEIATLVRSIASDDELASPRPPVAGPSKRGSAVIDADRPATARTD